MLPTRTVYECPLDNCEWTHEVSGGPVEFADVRTFDELCVVLDGFRGPRDVELPTVIERLARQHVANVDDVLRAHLETHTVMEWASTVARLRAELAAQMITG